MVSRWNWLIILGVAVLLRLIGLTDSAFDFDECYELDHLSMNVLDVARDGDGFPPLYRWLLSFFCFAFGEASARCFSALVGILSVIGIVYLTRCIATGFLSETESNLAGYRAGFFAAVSPHQIVFSQQARGYVLYVFMAVLVCWVAWELSHRPTQTKWFAFLFSCALGFATHYYFCLLVVQAWVWVAVALGTKRLRIVVSYAAIQVLVCLPILYSLSIDFASELPPEAINHADWTGILYAGFTLFSGWTLGPSWLVLQRLPLKESLLLIGPWAFCFAFLLTILSYFGVKRLPPRCYLPVWTSFVFTPFATLCIAVMLNSSFAARYLGWLAVPVAVWLGLCSSFHGRTIRTTASYGLICLSLIANWNRVYDPHYRMDDANQLKNWLDTNAKQLPVLVLSHYFASSIDRVLRHSNDNPSRAKNDSLNESISKVTAISLASDEPLDWGQVLPRFLEESLNADRQSEYIIVARLLVEGNPLHFKRDKILSGLGAKPVAIVSNNIQVFRAQKADLKQWISTDGSFEDLQ